MTALYPVIEIERIKKPNRWYAIPLLGFLFKFIIALPVSVELFFLRIMVFAASILNSCNIFFKGRYWKMAYDLNIGTLRLEVNLAFFIFGLTDEYPGFSLTTTKDYTFSLPFNKSPNRFLATPILGFVARIILMIPYIFYRQILFMSALLAVIAGWISVLFKRKYPDTVFEIVRDSIRVDQATSAYFLGMSDSYPSWWISMKHKPLKILLLILATIFTIWRFVPSHNNNNQIRQYQQYFYQNSAPINITPTITP
ncbi:MAG TPA: DUF4389 domain-containing protein [Patescibacteria group bacterium]